MNNQHVIDWMEAEMLAHYASFEVQDSAHVLDWNDSLFGK